MPPPDKGSVSNKVGYVLLEAPNLLVLNVDVVSLRDLKDCNGSQPQLALL